MSAAMIGLVVGLVAGAALGVVVTVVLLMKDEYPDDTDRKDDWL